MKTFLSLVLVTLFCAVAAAQLGNEDQPANAFSPATYETYEQILARYRSSKEYFGPEADDGIPAMTSETPTLAPDIELVIRGETPEDENPPRRRKAKSIQQLPTFVRSGPKTTGVDQRGPIYKASNRSIIREPAVANVTNGSTVTASQEQHTAVHGAAPEEFGTPRFSASQPQHPANLPASMSNGQNNVVTSTGIGPSSPIGTPVMEMSHPSVAYSSVEQGLSPVPKLSIPLATQDPDAMVLVAPYQTTAPPQNRNSLASVSDQVTIPSTYHPWWSKQVSTPLLPAQAELRVTLNELIHAALQHSPHIQLAATQPLIRQSSVFEESAQFDWTSFVEAKYEDTNDPIGNTLTTGNNADRFQQREGYSRSGIRRRNNKGRETELVQRLGFLDNNSNFLAPPNQGSSRLELNYRHPLMKGRGIAVNESIIVLADIDFRSAGDDFTLELQRHLSDITETYWELVRARSEYLQKTKLLVSAEAILSNLEGRSEVDTIDRQTFRARAVVASRRAEIARSLTAIENAESRLRLLVNSPALNDASAMELVPIDRPSSSEFPIELPDAVSTALAHRPDVSRAIRDVKAANVRNGVAANELLPKLDLLLGTYIAGLDGDYDALNSWVNQFRDGRPGYNVGIEFEIPIGNRAAKARAQRAEWEMKRAIHQFRAVVETGKNEVEVSVREVQTSRQEIMGRYYAMIAAKNETEFLIDRWETLPEVDDSATLLLEDLLDSQERLADEEAAFSRARFAYAVSIVRLKRAMGVLMQHSQ